MDLVCGLPDGLGRLRNPGQPIPEFAAALPRHTPRALLQFPVSGADKYAVATARRVLVVDDDEGVRLMFSRALRLDGHSVLVAATAEEALRDVEQDRPDAILLDLKMPLINGVGFLFRLRQDPANDRIPVAVITGVPTLDDATVNDLRALNAQVWHKPLSIEDVQQVARALLTRGPV